MSCPCNRCIQAEGRAEMFKQAAEVRQQEIDELKEKNRILEDQLAMAHEALEAMSGDAVEVMRWNEPDSEPLKQPHWGLCEGEKYSEKCTCIPF